MDPDFTPSERKDSPLAIVSRKEEVLFMEYKMDEKC